MIALRRIVNCTTKNKDCLAAASKGDRITSLLAQLKECSRSRDLASGKAAHCEALNAGLCSNTNVASSLINMYAKCSSMEDALQVFRSLVRPDVVSWNSLIQGYIDNAQPDQALELFQEMEDAGAVLPNARTYVAALAACSSGRLLELGKAIHSRAARSRSCDMFVENALVDMYAKSCSTMIHARTIFDTMLAHDVVSWTTLLQGYVRSGDNQTAVDLYDQGGVCGFADSATYVVVLAACGAEARKSRSCSWIEKAKALHSLAVKRGCCNSFVENSLVDMYAKSGSMVHARSIFWSETRLIQEKNNNIGWSALLQGYVENGESALALELFEDGVEHGFVPDAKSYVVALTACIHLGSASDCKRRWIQKGKVIHSQAMHSGCCNLFVENTLINLYRTCGDMYHAQTVFDGMAEQTAVSWSCLIRGYVEQGQNELALKLFAFMDLTGAAAADRDEDVAGGGDPGLWAASLAACGNLMALKIGRIFHEEIRRRRLEQHDNMVLHLVDFYSKCGCMEAAKQVFDSATPDKAAAWNTLLCGYASNGNVEEAFRLFKEMKERRLAPNELTFAQLLTACSHAGLTDQGLALFDAMLPEYGVAPNVVHYNCVVDLLGRSNHLDEALRLVNSMPVEPTAVTWRTLLSACTKWNNPALGRVAYQSLLKLDDKHAAAYNLMANIESRFRSEVQALCKLTL